ncbi:MAG: ATP-binding protein, partial [Oscillospiraceae bacterium]
SILMMGETGLGKTHLSLSIAEEITRMGFVAMYSSALDLFRTLQNEYYGKGEQGKNTMQTILQADLVIIDDLGAEFESQFNVSALYNIINSRLNVNKPIIISTNLNSQQIELKYSNRVASRVLTLYKCLKFVGKDIRQIKLKSNEL